jgi:hypothetical protein
MKEEMNLKPRLQDAKDGSRESRAGDAGAGFSCNL